VSQFSDAYKKHLSEQGSGAVGVSHAAPDFSALKNLQPAKQQGGQDFLSWLTDILSRPMRLVSNPAHQALTEIEKAHEQGGKYDLLGGLGNIVTAPTRGFFSTSKDDQPDWSHNIEQGTDVVGALTDPNYKNVPDNVAPLAKGIGGFIGDVALDPTTYLGGLGFAKKGVQLGANAAEDILTGTEDAAKVADAVAPKLDNAGNIVGEKTNLIDNAASTPESPLPTLAQQPRSDLLDHFAASSPKAPTPVSNPEAFMPNSVLRALDKTTTPAQKILKDLAKPAVVKAAAKATTDFATPLQRGAWMKEFATSVPEAQLTPTLKASDLLADPGLAKLPENQAVLEQLYTGYTKGFDRASKQGKYLQPNGKIVKMPKPPAGKPLNTLQQHSAMERFRQLRSTDNGLARLEKTFGANIVNRLTRTTNPALFDQKVQHLNEILDRTVDLNVVKSNSELQPIQQALLSHLGIDTEALANIREANNLTKPSRVAEAADAHLQAAVEKATKAPPQAEQIVKEMRSPDLSAAEQEVVTALPEAWKNQFFERYPYKTKTGVDRTSTTPGEGLGKRSGIFNQYAQMSLRKKLSDKGIERVRGFKGSAKKRAETLQADVMERMRLSDDMAAHFGVPLYIGVSSIDLLPLSLHQAYTLFDKADHPATLRMLFNQKTAVPDTNLMDAVNVLYRGGSHEEAKAALLNNTRRNLGQDGKVLRYPNRLVDEPSDLVFGHYGKLGVKQGGIPKAPAGARLVANGDKGWYVKYDAEFLAEEYVKTIEKAMPSIRKAVSMNAEDYATRLASESGELTAAGMQKIEGLVNNPDVLAEAIRSVGKAPEDVADVATTAHATQDSVDIATSQIEGHIDPSVQAMSESAVDSEKINKGAFGNTDHWDQTRFEETKKPTNRALRITGDEMSQQAKLAEAEMAAAGDTAAAAEQALKVKVPTLDVSEDVAVRVESGWHHLMDPLRRIFDARFGNANVWDVLHGNAVMADARRTKVGRELGNMARRYSGLVPGTNTTYLQKAYNDWRMGVRGTDNVVNSAIDDIERAWGRQWVGDGALMNNDFFRNSNSFDAVRDAMEAAGLDTEKYAFDLEKAAADAAKAGTSPLEEALKQVRQWETDDPVDLMHRMYTASESLASKAAIAGNFVDHFSKLGLVSKTAKPGFVRIEASGKNVYTKFLPDDIYVDKDIAGEWHVFDKVASMSRTPDGELGRFVTRYFDPIQRAWKFAITLPRPGHHIRNMVGDSSMTFVARGIRYYRRSSTDAFKLLSMSRGYDGVDLNRVMGQLGVDAMPKGSEILSKGKYGKLSYQEVLDAAYRNGMFPSFSTLEDLIGVEAKSGLQNVMDKLTLRGGKFENALGTVSEYRDHWGRLQHFVQAIHQMQKDGVKGARSIDDIYTEAAREVRKYHPDGSSLTPFEAKYMRRIIPFYTWFRGVLPTIVTTTVTKPGRVLAFPKASYNLSVAMGIHPDSMSDPFPDDQMFPSFLTDQATGPQFRLPDGRYLGFSPGIAHFDVANSLTNPLRGVAGMVTPIIRVPAELIGNSQWGTGTQIRSVPDYIDQNLPGVGYVANISGVSPTGTVTDLLQGKFGIHPQQGTTPNLKGVTNKDLTDRAISGFNWTTGLGALDMSKPNYISYAQIEKRNAATGG
jgi:hypothetical protein